MVKVSGSRFFASMVFTATLLLAAPVFADNVTFLLQLGTFDSEARTPTRLAT
jgi:hypothetical protein